MAFQDCKYITKIYIPDSVKKIGSYAFERCYSLKEINLPPKLKRIEEFTFMDCKELSEVNIPDSVRIIDRHAFWHCNSLTEIRLPDSLATIGVMAFPYHIRYFSIDSKNKKYSTIDGILYNKDVTELISVPMSIGIRHFIVPDTVRKIRMYAFNGCNHIESITLPEGLLEFGASAFRNCESLDIITLPEGITKIPEGAFGECWSLREVFLPQTLKKIGNWAFLCCGSLKTIIIPESVKSIEEYSLPSTIKEVHVSYNNPKEAAKVFRPIRDSEYSDDYRFKLYVPHGIKASYMKNGLFANWLTIKEERK